MEKIIILGAGLAGLSAAYHLNREYELIERSATHGGIAGSVKINGFTFDHAIHILFTKDPYASRLIRTLLGNNFLEQKRSSWIYTNDRYTQYPYQGNMKGLPKRIIWENLFGLLLRKFYRKAKHAHNFEEWIGNRFGTGIAKNFMIPFNKKVWAAELRSMSHDWIDDRVQEPRFRDVAKGIYSKKRTDYGPNATFWYPLHGGTSALPDSFLPFIQSIQYGQKCIGLNPETRTLDFQNGKKKYEILISSLPLPQLIAIIKNPPYKVSLAAGKLKANRVTTVNLGIEREEISKKHWVYFPEERFIFQRISFPMNFSPSLVPSGTSSIMAEISSSDYRPLPQSDIIEQTISQLTTIGVLRKNDQILVKKIIHIEPAYIIYTPEHRESVDTIHRYLRSIGIIPCGRFGEWEYLNMDQTILSGKRAAEEASV